jgi:tetratricopeptide (TPR) repeat protein
VAEGRPPVSREGSRGEGLTHLLSHSQVLDLLAAAGRCLLVLDGLEKVQEDGSRGGAFGQILDSRLRDLVLRVADGWFPKVSLVVTTRFRLYDPESKRAWYYRQIEVEQLQASSAVRLLRARGVRGTDEQLEHVAREQGFHALSIDLVGGYIARFCHGDSQRFSSLALVRPGPADVSDPILDPRLAALRDQERKFARITERYHQALAKSDPAALSLLQRICLFRLSIDTKTLAAIFTGTGKTQISGPELAGLNERELLAKLQILGEMGLLEVSKTQTFAVHPAVRDGFLRSIDAETERLGHIAVCEGLEASLAGKPGGNLSDPETLDLVEEIIYHTLAAGRAREAWDIYWSRIGGFRNLGLRLSDYARGDRICRAFLGGQPVTTDPIPAGLSENDQANFINGWGLYLKELGDLATSARCYRWLVARDLERLEWKNASSSNENLANVLLLAGCLTAGLLAIEDAIRLLKGADAGNNWRNRYAHRALARALRGDLPAAMADFDSAIKWQHESETQAPDRPLYSLVGIWHGQLLARLGRRQEVNRITVANQQICLDRFGDKNPAMPGCNLLLADLACERGDFSNARELQREAHRWASTCDAKEPLCWSALVLAKIELAEVTDPHSGNHPTTVRTNLFRAASALQEGLRIACDCGYGIYHIDLLLVRTRLALHEGRAADAERDVHVALEEGVHPATDSAYPELFAASDPKCLYAWGVAEGRHLLGEALLLQAAQKLGQAEFVPKRLDRLPIEVRNLIDRAREQLGEALELWRKLRDPESEADINPRGERTRRVIEQLDGGVLTEYPLEPTKTETETEPMPMPPASAAAGFDVFLSHNNKDKPTVRQLGEALKQRGLTVWLDEWELVPGRPWQEALEGIVQTTRAAAVLVGSDDIGPWQDREMRGCLSEFVDRGLPVIPVLLPGASNKPDLPMFLKQFTWVDLRGGLTNEGIDRVQWGVTGKKPGL